MIGMTMPGDEFLASNRRRMTFLSAAAVALCALVSPASAEIFRVGSYSQFTSALSQAGPGDSIILSGGTYEVPCNRTSSNAISFSGSGSSSNPIFIGAENGSRAEFDFGWPDNSKVVTGSNVSSLGFDVTGNYLYFKNISITKAGYQGAYVKGSHITFENCVFHDNWNSGLEINKGGSYVTVLNCDAYRNFDSNYKQGGMADGFASKQTQGPGNRFIGCRAWENSDDGYDTFDSPEVVEFTDCWAFRNGVDVWNFSGFDGNGNGFKVGGNHVVERNVLTSCVAFGNVVKGFDQNNNRGGVTILNCTSYRNGINFGFGGDLESGERHTIRNNISLESSGSVSVSNADQSHNTWNSGFSVSASDFVSLDTSLATARRNANGSLPQTDLFRLRASSDLVNRGVDVGLSYYGSAPDMGAFELQPSSVYYTIEVTAQEGGQVVQNPQGSSLAENSTVTFTAQAREGYVFTGWSGFYSGSEESYTVSSLNSDVFLTANFAPEGPVMYNIVLTASEGGKVIQNPEGERLEQNTSVTFTAQAEEGYVFAGWSGDYNGSESVYTVSSLRSDVSLKAVFVSENQLLYEAEEALMTNAVSENVNGGYSGSGYVNFDNEPESSVQFTVYAAQGGEKDFAVTFANGTSEARAMSVTVNGQEVESALSFAGTGSWTSWDQQVVALNLEQGLNTVTFISAGSEGGPNIDKIEIRYVTSAFERKRVGLSSRGKISYDPAAGSLQLFYLSGATRVDIFSLDGQLVFTEMLGPSTGTVSIRLPGRLLNSGSYLVRTTAGGKRMTERVNVVR